MSTEQRGRDTTDAIDTMPETEPTESYSGNVPELSKGERREVARRTRLSAIVVHETCVRKVNGSYNVIPGL